MSKFINSTVSFSQTNFLKKNILSPQLLKYNEYIQKQSTAPQIGSHYFVIPNNNVRYYMFVTTKKKLDTQCRDNFNILYFFQAGTDIDAANDADFYMEINGTFEHEMLFEGYLYHNDNRKEYLMTDILMTQGDVIDSDYAFRFFLLNEILPVPIKYLNDHLSIKLHPVFDNENENIIKIFMDNFIFKDDIQCITKISNGGLKQTFVEKLHANSIRAMKYIEKTNLSEVYNVYNASTNNKEGILYIKGLDESKRLIALFKEHHRHYIECQFNIRFQKWQPFFDKK